MKWLIFIFITLSLGSCATFPTMSYSTSQNVPLLEKKNQVRISESAGSQLYGTQGAYAFTKSFAVMGSYSTGLTFDAGHRNSWELAAGYYRPKDSSTFEVFGGAERYHRDFLAWNDEQAGTLPSDTFRTNATKYFVQIDGALYKKNHCIAGSMKIGYLVYDHFYLIHFGAYGAPNTYVKSAKSGPVIEPCVTYRLGMHELSFQAQAGFSFQNSVSMYDTGGGLFFNVGLSLKLFGK